MDNGIGAQPALRFFGGESLSIAWIPPGGTSKRAFAVVIKDASAGMVFSHGGTWKCGERFALTVGSFLGIEYNCGQWWSSEPKGTPPTILVVNYDGTALSFFANGRRVLSQTATLRTAMAYGTKIGADFQGKASFFQGDLGEYVAFSTDLSAPERKELEAYLSTKFGIPLE